MVTGLVSSLPRFLPSTFIAHKVQQSHCSVDFSSSVAVTHGLALPESHFVHKKKPLARTNAYEYAHNIMVV